MDEFPVNVTTTGDQDQPGVAGLQGTQFITVWRDASTQDIKGRLFGVNGAPSSGEFNINFPQTPGTKRQLPNVIETGQGFAVAWIEQLPGGKQHVKLRAFDGDTLSGPESQVSKAEVEPLIRPAMSRLADGGFIVVWADPRADERIRGQKFAIDGTKDGQDFRANTVAGLHRIPMAAGLTNGNFVIAWRARLRGPLLIHFQMFGARGLVGTEQTTQLEVTDAAMTPLDAGRFATAHVRSALDGETGFDTVIPRATVFNANGTQAGQFAATTGQLIQSSNPALATLPGGRFLLGWTQSVGSSVQARIFSATGAVGQVTRVNTSSGGNRFSLAAATTSGPEGNTAFLIWADDSHAAPDTSGRAIKGRVLTIPTAGF